MIFTTKKIKTQSLGEYLGACRARLRYTVEEAAAFTQVQPKYIEALEEGRFARLPAAVYVKGFLRSLARVYRVDERWLLEQFQSESEISRNVEIFVQPVRASRFGWTGVILTPKTLAVLGAVASGLLSFGYLYFQLSSINRLPELEIFSPAADGPVSESAIVVRGKTESGATLFLNNQAIVVDASGEFRENLSLGPGANQLLIKAVNKFGKETAVSRSIFLPEKEIAGSFTTDEEDLQKLVAEVMIGPESAWIRFAADGIELYAGTMLPNARTRITAQDRILLTTGNAGSTRMVLNGKDLGVLGKAGEVIRDIEFTK